MENMLNEMGGALLLKCDNKPPIISKSINQQRKKRKLWAIKTVKQANINGFSKFEDVSALLQDRIKCN